MTPEQRYFFDTTGYLHLKNVLNDAELHQTREAAERYIHTPAAELPPGFAATEGQHATRYLHAFAFDKSLEGLTMHPQTWPIVRELTGDKPRFASGPLAVNTHQHPFHPLHSAREGGGGPEMPRYFCKNGRIFCDYFIVFFYLSDVLPGDGGLLVVPGSHKSAFERPDDLFYQSSYDNEGYECHGAPPGVTNIAPRAGDVVIISELLTHGALNWKPKDRDRHFLILRYIPHYTSYRSTDSFPKEIKAGLSPETLELTESAPYKHTKMIVEREKAHI